MRLIGGPIGRDSGNFTGRVGAAIEGRRLPRRYSEQGFVAAGRRRSAAAGLNEGSAERPSVRNIRTLRGRIEELGHGTIRRLAQDLPAAPILVCGVCGNTVYGEAQDKCSVCGVAADKFFEVK